MEKLKEVFGDVEFIKRLAVAVAGLAVVLGAQWTPEQVAEWMQTVIEAIGVLLAAVGAVTAGLRMKDKNDSTE